MAPVFLSIEDPRKGTFHGFHGSCAVFCQMPAEVFTVSDNR